MEVTHFHLLDARHVAKPLDLRNHHKVPSSQSYDWLGGKYARCPLLLSVPSSCPTSLFFVGFSNQNMNRKYLGSYYHADSLALTQKF